MINQAVHIMFFFYYLVLDLQPQSLVAPPPSQAPVATKPDNLSGDPNSIEAQRDVYRRMLNYSMSSTLAQQYYLSQYGYNYMQVSTFIARVIPL